MNSTFIPNVFSRYFTKGAALRANSVGDSSGIAVTLNTGWANVNALNKLIKPKVKNRTGLKVEIDMGMGMGMGRIPSGKLLNKKAIKLETQFSCRFNEDTHAKQATE